VRAHHSRESRAPTPTRAHQQLADTLARRSGWSVPGSLIRDGGHGKLEAGEGWRSARQSADGQASRALKRAPSQRLRAARRIGLADRRAGLRRLCEASSLAVLLAVLLGLVDAGWPGALQPPAPTDPGVTVSHHPAPLTMLKERGPTAIGRRDGAVFRAVRPPPLEPLVGRSRLYSGQPTPHIGVEARRREYNADR